MKRKNFALVSFVFVILAAGIAAAYPVYTSWTFNMSGVDVEAYHCSDNSCASVSGPFYQANTGSASSVSINYDAPNLCESNVQHYTAYYFYKDCYLPMEGYVWSTCDYSYTDNINFYKKTGCTSDILSVDNPSSAQTGQSVSITANVKSAQKDGITPPAYIPPARKSQYYSSDILVTLSVKKDGAVVYTDSRTVNVFQDSSQNVGFSWTPSSAGTYTLELSTDVTDCKCSSSVKQSSSRSITVTSPAQADSCADTDGGNAIGTFGATSGYLGGQSYSHSDYCVDSDTVNEYFCVGNVESSQQQSCGTDGYVGSNYCSGSNVYKDFKDYSCSSGACASATNPVLQQACQYGCTNGVCNSAPSQNTPPVISGIPDYSIKVGETIPQIDLEAYASDSQDSDSSLSFMVISQSNTDLIDCYITISGGKRYITCSNAKYAGYSDVTVKVTDTGGLTATDTFRINVQSQPQVNTPPVISGLPDQDLQIGQTIPLLDLYPYTYDSQDQDSSLGFSIDYQSNPGTISCYITGNRYLGCGAGQYQGYNDVTVRVTDTGGLSGTDTLRINVQSQPSYNHAPAINSLSITPSNPKDSEDLACNAEVTDQDGNLNRIQFRWFVDGGLAKTRNIYVSGSFATAQDTLGSTSSSTGQNVRCEATVFDAQGLQSSDSDSVTIESQSCGVDVYMLEILDSNRIRFRLRNTGAVAEGITYRVYVNDNLIQESTRYPESNEWSILQESYYFGNGEFLVKVKATADCGDTDTEAVLHTRGTSYSDLPSVDSISITPTDPDENDDLTCRADVSDPDSGLDRIKFRWLVEGSLERTRTVDVSGSSDTAEDTLDSYSFSDGDEVECEATVYDSDSNSDSSSDSVTIGGDGHGCGVDVFNLRAIGDEIRFEVRNTGNRDQDINYKIYVEDQVVEQSTIWLDSGERRTVQESFYFGNDDDYFVKVKVTADCGSTDWESVYHQTGGQCETKYLDEYRCNGLWSQRKYQNSDCSTLWVNMESCPNGCFSGFCSGSGGQCGLLVQKFDFQTSIIEGNVATVTLEAKNTGARQETIIMSLTVDGELKESQTYTASQGSSAAKIFSYYPSLGTHTIIAKAQSSCGSVQTKSATVTVMRPGTGDPYQPTPSQPEPSLPTSVSIYPVSLDAGYCEGKAITIDIYSAKTQTFSIAVAGIPEEWMNYQSQNVVEKGYRKLYVFVSPKEMGTHKLSISVKALGEGSNFQQDVSIYTAGCRPQEAQGTDFISGYFIEASQNPAFWLIVLILVISIVVIIGFYRLKPDVEYYEPEYYPAYDARGSSRGRR